eukprot:TRINITY_DN2544_c0_g2_i1.p1 TRINITY_DN2544_c0_g2~~TRINITY_DN2544_c0_g2_i1.p1  ORF type:complete len:274 (+),score=55.93 TRINITY_DN2544_c0_g2_i1:22-843(+)
MASNFHFDVETKLMISISARPSVFGYTLYNNMFQKFSLNYMYKPYQVTSEEQFKSVISGIRGLGISGASVSMPFKETALQYMDDLDPSVKKIKALNTIKNTQGKLVGYNTDYEGAKDLFREFEGKSVLIVGLGGVAKAVTLACLDCKMNVTISGRDPSQLSQFAAQFNVSSVPWSEINGFKATVFVNCTPVGMEPHTGSMVIQAEALGNFEVVADLVTKPPRTHLIQEAEAAKKRVIMGSDFMLHQFIHQFKIYLGIDPPIEDARMAISQLIK